MKIKEIETRLRWMFVPKNCRGICLFCKVFEQCKLETKIEKAKDNKNENIQISPELKALIKEEFKKHEDTEDVLKLLKELINETHEIATRRHNWLIREHFKW